MDLIRNMSDDIADIYIAHDAKKISNKEAIEKIRNLCFYFLKASYDKKK